MPPNLHPSPHCSSRYSPSCWALCLQLLINCPNPKTLCFLLGVPLNSHQKGYPQKRHTHMTLPSGSQRTRVSGSGRRLPVLGHIPCFNIGCEMARGHLSSLRIQPTTPHGTFMARRSRRERSSARKLHQKRSTLRSENFSVTRK